MTHLQRTPVDLAQAHAQWSGYVSALRDCGWEAVEVPGADDCPDAVFVEDTMVVSGDMAVIARPGAQVRRPETRAAETAVRELGYRVERIEAPGTLDGGDVLKVGPTAYAGLGGRTNQAGLDQLRQHLRPLGVEVVAVPVSRVLHLKSAVTALPDGTVIGYPPLVDDAGLFPSFLAVPEQWGAHVVDLGDGRLLLAASAPLTAELLTGRGWTPCVVDISEFERLEGCVTCLSVRLRGAVEPG